MVDGRAVRRALTAAGLALALALGLAGCGAPAGAPAGAPEPTGGGRPPSFEDKALWVDPRPGDCPHAMKVFDPEAGPQVGDLAAQLALGRSVRRTSWGSFRVRYTRPTALGLAVLVDGDLPAARRRLAEQGIHVVGRYGDQDDLQDGVDPEYEARLLVSAVIDPVASLVRHRTQGLTGAGDIAPWLDAGSVLLLWKRPVPPEVQQLTRLRPASGVRVVVEGAAYSLVDLAHAEEKLGRLFGRGSPLTMMGTCGDDSGLIVGVRTSAFTDRADALRRRYAAIAGVPVTVVAQDPAGALI